MHLKSFYIIALVLLFSFVLIEYSFSNQFLFKIIKSKISIKNILPFQVSNKSSNKFSNECSPFTNMSSFSIEIDGEKYPKWVSLSRNKSINYNCLNKNKKFKIILLWNKFFNREDHHYGLGRAEPFLQKR